VAWFKYCAKLLIGLTVSTIDKVSAAHQEELAKLKTGKKRLTFVVVSLFAALFIFSFLASSIPNALTGDQGLERARQELVISSSDWGRNLSHDQQTYALWLKKHGLEIEQRLYTQASQVIFSSATKIESYGVGEFVSKFLATLHFSFLRVAFVLVACWRIWIVGIVLAALYVYWNWRVYLGQDILGQMSTGQLFYSGLRADLSKVSATGAPEKQVTGLACPQIASETEGSVSALGKVLKRWRIDNQTNQMLVRIITAYKDWPAYVAEIDNEAVFNRFFSGAKLLDHAAKVLENLMQLQALYQNQKEGQAIKLDPHFEGSEVAEEKVSCSEYAWLIQHSCQRVLTPLMTKTISELSPTLIATVILSHFSGKVMAYGFQGGKWIRRSNFPELCARAILHSVPAFGEEYVFEERAIIRRSLIYGSRNNIFAPVRFPVDLSPEARALRQWVEILMALPHQLQSTSDEVELLAVLHEMHVAWNKGFFEGAVGMQKEIDQGTYATQSNLFIAPVENLVMLIRRTVSPEVLRRAEELTALVSQKQRLESMADAANSSEAQGEKGALYNQGKIFAPLNAAEIKDLSAVHGVPEGFLRDWSALRAMLNQYGWLARRVGDYSVPEHGIIFSVLRTDGTVAGSNDLGMVGRSGMVALRGTRVEQRWGKQWQGRFVQAISATMAETQEHFEKLMRGIEDRPLDDADLSLVVGGLSNT
jgi:hypothetical protein